MASFPCSVCGKILGTRHIWEKHLHTVHSLDKDGKEMEVDRFVCTSKRCDYTTVHRYDMKKHLQRCTYVLIDHELLQAYEKWQMEVGQLINKEREDFAAERDKLGKTIAEMFTDNNLLREQLGKTIAGLQAENNLLRKQLEESQKNLTRLAEKAIDRPTIQTTTNHHGNVKITNYLTDHQTYLAQTDPKFVTEQAKKHWEKYFLEWLNSQRALAKFVVNHIIRCADTGNYILCCTDTSRRRFIYINHGDEKAEDMLAKLLVEKIAKPIKDVSHAMFREIVNRLEDQKRTVPASERFAIDRNIDSVTERYFRVCEFDLDEKNSDFVTELAGLLRGPSGAGSVESIESD